MATKKKSGGSSDAKKALAGIEKAHKALQLNIKNLKTALGHIHAAGKGHVHSASGRAKGHVHAAANRPKGHPHGAV